MSAGSSPWITVNAVLFDLVMIPAFALLIFFLMIVPRTLLKPHMRGVSLLCASILVATMMLLAAVWAATSGLAGSFGVKTVLQVLSAALLLSAWLVPREIRASRK